MYSGSWNAPKVKTIESFRLGGNTTNNFDAVYLCHL
jgi:hypothetical protein